MMSLSMKKKVDFEGVWRSSRESRPVEILEPQWCNDKLYLKIRKEKKGTFESGMPNMKTEMNYNLLRQTIEKRKRT